MPQGMIDKLIETGRYYGMEMNEMNEESVHDMILNLSFSSLYVFVILIPYG